MRSLNCTLFCHKARTRQLEHERSVDRNIRHSQDIVLILKVPLVTKTEFLLTLSLQYQADK